MDENRRKFIRSAATSIAAAPVIASAALKNSSREKMYDVIVVGGGFAGVTAARETSMRGYKTLLLEARSRLGGRADTVFLADRPLDIGATWIGWSQPHVWAEMMRYDLEVKETAAAVPDRAIWFRGDDRMEGSLDEYAGIFERAADAFYKPAREAFPRPFDPRYSTGHDSLDAQTALEAIENLRLDEVERDVAMSLAAINGHAHPDQSSYLDQLRWFALGDFDVWNMWDNLGRYRVRGGMKILLDHIHSDCRAETLLDSPVRSIEQKSEGVEIFTQTGKNYVGRTAIITVPLNCLADVDFKPALGSTKIRVSNARHTGSGTKVYARIKGRSPTVMCTGKHDMPLSFLWTEYGDRESQILVGFGASDKLLDIHSEKDVLNALRNFLPEVDLIDYFTHDWNDDPYSRGTWCMYRPETLTKDFGDLQKKEGRLYFASADIARGWRGFVDGAIESGLRVSHEVASFLVRDR